MAANRVKLLDLRVGVVGASSLPHFVFSSIVRFESDRYGTSDMTPALWILGLSLLTALVVTIAVRVRATRIALRALHRSGSRIDRFKLTKKAFIRETLLADEGIARAVKEHAAENSMDEKKAWSRVEEYIDEIVPFFNILTYYKIGDRKSVV